VANALNIEFQIGDASFKGRLPLIPNRFRLTAAYYEAIGTVVEDENGDPELDEKGNLIWEGQSVDDVVACYCAAIGFCWTGDAPWPSFRKCGRDVVDFGENIHHHLLEDNKYTTKDIIKAGKGLRALITASSPKVSEVQEEEDFSGGPEGPSTASSSE